MARLPISSLFEIESKIYFHKFDDVEQEGLYNRAKAIVLNNKVVSVEEV